MPSRSTRLCPSPPPSARPGGGALQRQAGAGFHRDPFHLPAGSFSDAGAASRDGRSCGAPCPPAAGGLQLLHHGLDLLGLGAIRNQHGVVGFHHHEVFNAQTHHQAVFAAQIAVAAAFADHGLAAHCRNFALRFPRALQLPTSLQLNQWQNTAQFRFFHHGHVNGHVGALGKGFRSSRWNSGHGPAPERHAAAHHLGQSLQFGQHGAGAEQEHAAVPGEAAGARTTRRGRSGPWRLIGTWDGP